MPQGTLNQNKDAYVSYEFVCVKCNVCGQESNSFVYKEHLNPDESIQYIEETTGFELNKTDGARLQNFVSGQGHYDKGGLICPTCIESEQIVKEVV